MQFSRNIELIVPKDALDAISDIRLDKHGWNVIQNKLWKFCNDTKYPVGFDTNYSPRYFYRLPNSRPAFSHD